MKTLRYIFIDAVIGGIAMLLMYLVGSGIWLSAKKLYLIYTANEISIVSGIAVSMVSAGLILGAFIGWFASRQANVLGISPKTVTPEQLDKMESILSGMTFNANPEDVDVEEIKRTISELGSNLSEVDLLDKSPSR
jgi:hypothetical protein